MMRRLVHHALPLAFLTIFTACGGKSTNSPPRMATDDEVRSLQRDPASNGAQGTMDEVENHMLMSPGRAVKPDDTARAMSLADKIRKAVEKYQDTTAAINAGYEHFVQPAIGEMHFTNYSVPVTSKFDAEKPVALLYRRQAGSIKLAGAMYNLIGTPSTLEAASPLSLVHWHKHINWCIPKPNEQARWYEKRRGRFVFGNFGTSSESECNRAGGVFIDDVGGWMVHAYVEGQAVGEIWGGTQMGSHMHEH